MKPHFFLLVGLYWICGHFLLYAFFLRGLKQMAREKVIFLYHFVSFVFLSALCLVVFLCSPSVYTFALATLILSVHGIYSLSFLELWSLADGSYSLKLLSLIDKGQELSEKMDVEVDPDKFGASKLSKRRESLHKLRLISSGSNKERLTLFGFWVAVVLKAIRWLTAGRSMNNL